MPTNTSDPILEAYEARKALYAARDEAKRAYLKALDEAAVAYAQIVGPINKEFRLFDQDAS